MHSTMHADGACPQQYDYPACRQCYYRHFRYNMYSILGVAAGTAKQKASRPYTEWVHVHAFIRLVRERWSTVSPISIYVKKKLHYET